MPEQVGFIGLGIMGSLQAMNLAKAGYELTVFNRTREKAERWVAEHYQELPLRTNKGVYIRKPE